jgi:hypothetical protein
MATGLEFRVRMDRRTRDVDAFVKKLMLQVALKVDEHVVLATPVDTGRARSNWRVNVGAPARAVIPPFFPGKGLGLGERSNAEAAFAQARSALNTFVPGKDVYISNNVHYINLLNQGTSSQAARNFVQTAALAGAREVVQARKVFS